MKQRHSLLTGFLLVSATSALSLPGQSEPPTRATVPHTPPPAPMQKAEIVRKMDRLPLAFESNQGQSDATVRFLAHTSDSTLFLTPSEAVFTMPLPEKQAQNAPRKDRKVRRAAEKLTRLALRMQMVGANAHAAPLHQQPLAGRVNYFVGKDPRKWQTDVPTFGRVGFQGVYPGIDLVYYGNRKHLEYDFLVAPHADPKQIKLRFAGAQTVRLSPAGELLVQAEGQELRWQKPVVYQQDKTGKHPVDARFRLQTLPNGQQDVRFALGRYDTSRPLVIDPVLVYSTYLGGSTTTNGDQSAGIAIDSSGSAYLTGTAYSADFPTTAGAFRTTKAAGASFSNAFVTKLNATGTGAVYSTYLGGSTGFGDTADGIAVDSSGSAYVTGYTSATDFPTSANAYQTTKKTGASFNAFVTKFNASGSALIYSTLIGGSTGDQATAIALDSGNNAYITGYSFSTNFPTTPGAYQTTKKGPTDSVNSFVTKLNTTGTALSYSTYIGGTIEDRAFGIAVDGSGFAYITGYAFSTDFPTTPGAYQTKNNSTISSVNAFVTKFNPAGTGLVYSTYLGGTNGDNAAAIAIDANGSAYVVGSAFSTDFPTTPGSQQPTKRGQGTANPNAFVTKLNATGTALSYSTYLGGTGTGGDGATGVAVDAGGGAYVVGYTHSNDFPLTANAVQPTNHALASDSNAFLTKLNAAGSALGYSTYLGGSGGDSAYGVALDVRGNIYLTGIAKSADFPVTPGAYQATKRASASSYDSFVAKISTTSIAAVYPDFNSDAHTDLLIQNPTTGAIASWFMNGTQLAGSTLFSQNPGSDYALVGVGDFSGNGATTLVLQSKSTNKVVFWFTGGANNATVSGGAFVNVSPDAGWKVVGVADFNADGRSDLVFQNQNTRQIAIWYMSGSIFSDGVILNFTPLTGWNVVGAGDANGDGFPDLVLQNQTTGQIALWYLNGTAYVDGKVLTAVPASGYKVVGVGDYNGDGSVDLLFQTSASSNAALWYLQNGAFAGGAALSTPLPSGWNIVGPR